MPRRSASYQWREGQSRLGGNMKELALTLPNWTANFRICTGCGCAVACTDRTLTKTRSPVAKRGRDRTIPL
jgi:hypothetical protein